MRFCPVPQPASPAQAVAGSTTAELPGGKEKRFTNEETDLLVREVKARGGDIYGDSRAPPKPARAKQAWQENAAQGAGQGKISLETPEGGDGKGGFGHTLNISNPLRRALPALLNSIGYMNTIT